MRWAKIALSAVVLTSSLFAQDLLKEAQALSDAHKFEQAAQKLKEFCERNPNAREQRLKLADAYLAAGLLLEALNVYEKYIESFPGDPNEPQVRLLLAGCYEARGQYTKASTTLKDFATRAVPPNQAWEALKRSGELYLIYSGEPDKARADFEQLLSRYPDNPNNSEVLYRLAQVQRGANKIKEAIDTLRKVVEKYRQSAYAVKAQAEIAFLTEDGGLKDWAGAIKEYDEYVRMNLPPAEKAAKLERVAWILRDRVGKPQDAVDRYDQALQLAPSSRLAWERIVAIEGTQNRDALIAALNQFTQSYPGAGETLGAYRKLAETQWAAGKQAEAINTLQTTAQKFSTPDDLYRLGQLQKESKQYDAAVATFAKVANTYPGWNGAEPFLRTAECLIEKGDAAGAEKFLLDTASAYAYDTNVAVGCLWKLGESVYQAQKNYPKAIETYARILKDYPWADPWVRPDYCAARIVQCGKELKNLDMARDAIQKVAAENPFHSWYRDALASVVGAYLAAGEAQKAIDLGTKVVAEIQNDSGAAYTFLYLGDAYGKLKERRKQLECYAELARFRTDPGYSFIHGEIDARRQQVIPALLYDICTTKSELAQWLLKQDPNKVGEKEKWFEGKTDNTWTPYTAGKDWGNYDGEGWLVCQVPASAEEGQYTISFGGVDDEAFVYVDSNLIGHQSGAFSLSFTSPKKAGQITIAVRIIDKGGEGGLLKPVVLSKPAEVKGDGLAELAIANHALGKAQDAAELYTKYFDQEQNKAKADAVRPFQHDAYYLTENLDRLANTPLETVRYYLTLARAYQKANRQADAIRVYDQAVQKFPKSATLAYAYAAYLQATQAWEACVNQYVKLIDLDPNAPYVPGLQRHVVWVCGDGGWRNFSKGRELGEKFTPSNPLYWSRVVGDMYFDRDPRDYSKALQNYQTYAKFQLGVDRWHVFVRSYDCLINLKNYPMAKKLAEDWAAANPGSPNLPAVLYRIAEATRCVGPQAAADAAKLFQDLQQKYPNHPAARDAVSNAAANLPTDVALAMLKKWETDNPADGASIAPMYWTLAARVAPTEPEKAMEFYNHLWKNYRWKWPENVQAADAIARVLESRWAFADLGKLTEEVTQTFGFNPDQRVLAAWWRLANSYGAFMPKKANADSSMNGYNPATAANGDCSQRGADANYTWMSAETGTEHWVEIEIPSAQPINFVEVYWPDPQNLPRSVKIQQFNGQAFVDVTKFEPVTASRSTYYFPPINTNKIRVVQEAQKGPESRPAVMAVSEVNVARQLTDEQYTKLFAVLQQIRDGYRGGYDQWNAGLAYCNYLAMKGEYLRADIEMQRLIYLLPRNNPGIWDQVMADANRRIAGRRFSEAGSIIGSMLALNPGIDAERRRVAEQMLGVTLYESNASAAIIDPKKEEAPLLWGDVFFKSGEKQMAWQKFLDARKIFPTYEHLLSPEYKEFIMERLIAMKESSEARDIARRFLVRFEKDANVSVSDKAKVHLLLGDSYYADENFDLAREEYRTVLMSYKDTPEAIEAQFKIAQCLIAQKIYAKAEELLKELCRSPNREILVRAYLITGLLYHKQGELDKAKEEYQKVLSMFPDPKVADQVIEQLGTLFKEQNLYQEAIKTFRLMGMSGNVAKYVSPGDAFRVKLMDRNLSTGVGVKHFIPIVVKTTHGDQETLYLEKSPAGPGLFIAEMDVKLGDPTPKNKVIDVVGDDLISYDYDPDFAKDKTVTPIPKEYAVGIASDAELKVSSTEIKDEEENAAVQELLAQKQKRTGFRLFRKANEIKPGNPVYVQVTDADQDKTGDPDMVEVKAEASSGDIVNMKLKETERHSGKFRGAIKTGQRPPDANASDFAEGHSPVLAIDNDMTAKSAWIGAYDYRVPKWFAVDLKEVHPISKIVWDRGAGFDPKEDRAILNYVIELSTDNKTWFPIAAYPEGKLMLRGAIPVWDPDSTGYGSTAANIVQGVPDVAMRWVGKNNQKDYIIDLDLGRIVELEKTILRNSGTQFAVKQYEIYVEKDTGSYPGDDREVEAWNKVYTSPILPQPQPDEAALAKKDKDTVTGVSARFVRLRVLSCFGEHPEIGEFEIYPIIRSKVEPFNEKEGKIGATITFPTAKARHIRMTINNYHTDAPAIAYFGVFDERGKQLVPTDINILELANNKILEVSPGDTITVSYNDERNILNDMKPRLLQADMSATYYNGSILAITRKWLEDEQGNKTAREFIVKRIQPGDTFIVSITEFDSDTTDEIDKVPFTVLTSSGAKLSLEADETDPYSGIFTKEVRTSDQETPGTLLVKPGDSIELSYIDEYNTDPGNRIARTYTIRQVTPTDGKVRVARSKTMIEKPDGSHLNLINLDEKLAVEVTDPDRAKNSGDTVKVKLTTTLGVEQTLECKIQTSQGYSYVTSDKIASDLEKGRFYGEIRVVLGGKDSPSKRPIAVGTASEFSSGKEEENLPTEDVLNVSGGDTITITYEDTLNTKGQVIQRVDFARVIADGVLGIFDDGYENEIDEVHVGDNLFLKVEDADADVSDNQDEVQVALVSSAGEKETLVLKESLPHSGVFSGAYRLEYATKAEPANGKVEVDFGNEITVSYSDKYNTKTKDAPLIVEAKAQVVAGTDGTMMAFAKKYPDEDLAIETQYKIGECYYFLGREHIKQKETRLALAELAMGMDILRDLVIHHPRGKFIDQVNYLLGNLTMERREYDEAARIFRSVTREHEKSPVAPDAQYKLAMCYEKKGDFDKASEEYVRLAYKFPDNPLVGDAMIRIGLYYFDKKDYETSASVLGKFVERYPEDPKVENVAIKIGLCLMLCEKYKDAGDYFKKFVEKYPQSKFTPSALYWAGESYLKGGMAKNAFHVFKRCIWDYPDTDWAKFARARLTSPIFDNIKDED